MTEPKAPSLDRSRLRLPRHLLPTALLLVDHPGQLTAPGATGLASLEAAGVATAGSLHPTALRILTPVSAPRYVVSVDVFRDGAPTIATVWCGAGLATVGTSQDREIFVLDPVEPALIPFHLAALAGVGPRPANHGRPMVAGRYEDFTRILDIAAPEGSLDAHDMESLLTRDSITEPAAVRWRISTLWCEPDGFVGDRTIEFVDSGAGGYCEVTAMPGSSTLLTPRTLDSVLRLIGDAVPK